MHEQTTVISRKGRITIPAEIREALALQEGDKIIWRVEKSEIRLRKASDTALHNTDASHQSQVAHPAKASPEDDEQTMIEESVQQMFHNVNTRWPGQ